MNEGAPTPKSVKVPYFPPINLKLQTLIDEKVSLH